jgi:hypothetical protein
VVFPCVLFVHGGQKRSNYFLIKITLNSEGFKKTNSFFIFQYKKTDINLPDDVVNLLAIIKNDDYYL